MEIMPFSPCTPGKSPSGVHGEKGMISMRYLSKHTTIKDIQGGSAKNIVCRNCYVVIDKNSFSRKTLEDYFNNENLEFSIENVGENDVKISVQGIAAHASLPELGKNALSYLMDGLKQSYFHTNFLNTFNAAITSCGSSAL